METSEQISWHVELTVRPGKMESFRALTREMVELTRIEPGAICFERYISSDQSVVHIYERYLNSAAAVSHLLEFNKMFSQRFAESVERKQFTVFGSPSDGLRDLLNAYNPVYADLLDGFSTF